MGDIGNGNCGRYGARPTTDEFRSIDVRRWAREGMLAPGFRGCWEWTKAGETVLIGVRTEVGRIIISSQSDGLMPYWGVTNETSIYIVQTRCHLGGSRPWFVCPANGCGRRVAVLYAGKAFACRQCHGLVFASTREGASARAARGANRIRDRLHWEPGILNGRGDKPKWMRWRTFRRLSARHDELRHKSLQAMAVKA
jgi:hypothetical protein